MINEFEKKETSTLICRVHYSGIESLFIISLPSLHKGSRSTFDFRGKSYKRVRSVSSVSLDLTVSPVYSDTIRFYNVYWTTSMITNGGVFFQRQQDSPSP